MKDLLRFSYVDRLAALRREHPRRSAPQNRSPRSRAAAVTLIQPLFFRIAHNAMGRRFSGDGSAGCGAGTTAQNHVGVVAARVAGAPLPGIRAHTVADLAAGLPHGA
jgi:hypothetical protein